jgi:hypothetical protein
VALRELDLSFTGLSFTQLQLLLHRARQHPVLARVLVDGCVAPLYRDPAGNSVAGNERFHEDQQARARLHAQASAVTPLHSLVAVPGPAAGRLPYTPAPVRHNFKSYIRTEFAPNSLAPRVPLSSPFQHHAASTLAGFADPHVLVDTDQAKRALNARIAAHEAEVARLKAAACAQRRDRGLPAAEPVDVQLPHSTPVFFSPLMLREAAIARQAQLVAQRKPGSQAAAAFAALVTALHPRTGRHSPLRLLAPVDGDALWEAPAVKPIAPPVVTPPAPPVRGGSKGSFARPVAAPATEQAPVFSIQDADIDIQTILKQLGGAVPPEGIQVTIDPESSDLKIEQLPADSEDHLGPTSIPPETKLYPEVQVPNELRLDQENLRKVLNHLSLFLPGK